MSVGFTQYLRIENKAKAIPSIEYLSGLGVSSSRGDVEKIGQFGSGLPNALALFARHGVLEFSKLCMGLDVYTCPTVKKQLKDSSGRMRSFEFLRMKKQNGHSSDLNISTEFGELDWSDVTMGVREIISNAIDGAREFNGTLDSFSMELVDAEGRNTRAKEGTIRFYLPFTLEIQKYYENIQDTFICLRPNYNPAKKILINKNHGPAIMYRKGVKVGEFGMNSLFHYNIPDVDLKESRIIDSSSARDAAATAICLSEDENVYRIFLDKVINPSNLDMNIWESTLPTYELNPTNHYLNNEKTEKLKTHWDEAVQTVFGEGSILCGSATTAKMVENKGYQSFLVDSRYHDLIRSTKVKTELDVLNKNEIAGKEIFPANQNVLDTLDLVWSNITRFGMTAGRTKPPVQCFRQNNEANGMFGYYQDSVIYIRSDVMDGKSLSLLQTMLHEVAHHITQARDYSPEFQEFAFKLATLALFTPEKAGN